MILEPRLNSEVDVSSVLAFSSSYACSVVDNKRKPAVALRVMEVQRLYRPGICSSPNSIN